VHVHVTRSGGFVGLTLEGDLDTSALPPGDRERVEQVIAHLRPRGGPSAPDRFCYELAITTDEGETREVTLQEPDVPDELRHLFAATLRPAAAG
jgi:hypothetical protein